MDRELFAPFSRWPVSDWLVRRFVIDQFELPDYPR